MEFDTVDNKLYFADNNGISRANFDDMCAEVILQNISVRDMAIERLKRRIFWVEYLKKKIFVSDLNVTKRRVVIDTANYPSSIAVDPLVGYVSNCFKTLSIIYVKNLSWSSSSAANDLSSVYTATDKFVSGQIIVRIRFAFTGHYPIRTSF